MLREFTYVREGAIEFGLRSTSRRYRLVKGERKIIQVTPDDEPIIRSLGRLGIRVKDIDVKTTVSDTVAEPIISEPEKVEEPIQESEELAEAPEVVEEVVEETPEVPKNNYTLDGLMKNNLAKLRALADELGVQYPEDAHKREIAEAILAL